VSRWRAPEKSFRFKEKTVGLSIGVIVGATVLLLCIGLLVLMMVSEWSASASAEERSFYASGAVAPGQGPRAGKKRGAAARTPRKAGTARKSPRPAKKAKKKRA
jgi:hypothetical protein